MKRFVVNVSTGRYVGGARRLQSAVTQFSPDTAVLSWLDEMPPGSPSHRDIPYGFKAHAMNQAVKAGADAVLWADASILPIRMLDGLWTQIERDGYWICRNGWMNSEWTCDAAYTDLGVTREENARIPHVVATSFGVSMKHETGKRIFDEYLRLAQTRAFCGPWMNSKHADYASMLINGRCAPCGPANVRGHRHDQTALSLIAWRNACTLTDPPQVFAYRGGETERTVLVADSTY